MNSVNLILFKQLLSYQSAEQQQAIINCLPSHLSSSIQNINVHGSLFNKNQDERLDEIHPSFLEPFFRMKSEGEITLFLSSLTDEQAKNLKSSLLFSSPLCKLCRLAKDFFKNHLLDHVLQGENLLPISLLPENPLNEVTSLNFTEIHKLLFFLGIKDLSLEMPLLIDTKKINHIHSILSEEENIYLKKMMLQKEPVAFKPIGIGGYQQMIEPSLFKNLILQRGVNRLAKAFFGQHRDLIWYVTHKLNQKIAKTFAALCQPLDKPSIQKHLIQQVVNLTQEIKKSRTGVL
ncbi:MAG: hypothetical protein ACOVOR_03175 [Rhabdochlamydiaceae bacterium]